MASRHQDTAPAKGVAGERSDTDSIPAPSDIGDNSASELIEAPLEPGHDPLDAHDFGDGGGGGGGEAFRRTPRPR
jgi:hypothetical protein